MAVELEAKGLSKSFAGTDRQALDGIDLTLHKQELVVVIGPNGSGKSTLLKLIAGIEQPTAGRLTGAKLAGYLPQQPSLLPWRTVEQNLLLPAEVRKTPINKSRAKAQRLLKSFDLQGFANYYPHSLSGGTQQKVGLLRAVMSNPRLLLLDEPFAALDAITRLEMQRWLLDLKRQTRASVICVTHDIREAVFLADTIYVMDKNPGRIKARFAVPAQAAQRTRLESKLYKLLVAKP